MFPVARYEEAVVDCTLVTCCSRFTDGVSEAHDPKEDQSWRGSVEICCGVAVTCPSGRCRQRFWMN